METTLFWLELPSMIAFFSSEGFSNKGIAFSMDGASTSMTPDDTGSVGMASGFLSE